MEVIALPSMLTVTQSVAMSKQGIHSTDSTFFVLAKRLAGKIIAKITCFVSSGM